MGCSREELHISIGILFFFFATAVASDVGLCHSLHPGVVLFIASDHAAAAVIHLHAEEFGWMDGWIDR